MARHEDLKNSYTPVKSNEIDLKRAQVTQSTTTLLYPFWIKSDTKRSFNSRNQVNSTKTDTVM